MDYHYLWRRGFWRNVGALRHESGNEPVKAPDTAEELAELLRRPALHNRTIALAGNGSKRLMAGPNLPSDESFFTVNLNRVREYEPRDLTISV
jgi:hypothetical protein